MVDGEETFMTATDAAGRCDDGELSQAFLHDIRGRLLRLRDEVVRLVDVVGAVGTVESTWSNGELALAEIDRALERIAAGTYGRCSGCAAAIAAERLEMMPATERCLECRHVQETRSSSH